MTFGIKQSVSMAAIMSLQLIATFAIQIVVIRATGIGPSTDVYIAAQAVPALIATIIGVAHQSVWLTRLAAARGDTNAWRDAYSAAQGQAGLMGAVALVVVGGTQWIWQPMLFPGFSQFQNQDAQFFGWVFLIIAVASIQSTVFTTALRVKGRLFSTELIGLAATTSSLVAIYITVADQGLQAAAWIMLFRSLAVCGILMLLAEGRLPVISRGLNCREAWVAMRPLLLGAVIYKTTPLVDRYWVAQAPSGAMTILSLSQTAMTSVSSIIERAICMPIAPKLSHLAALRDYKSLRDAYRRGVMLVAMSVASFYALFVLLHATIEASLMRLLHVPLGTALEIWHLCVLLLGFTFASAAGTIVSAGFYALDDTSTPPRIGIITFFLGVLLKSIAFLALGLNGLVGAITVIYSIMIMMMMISFEKKISIYINDSSTGASGE